MRDIADPLTWAFCFMSYIAVKANHETTNQLVAYAQTIIQLYWKHGGLGWRTYDARFRQQLAAGVPLEWTKVEPSILATSVIRAASESPLCSLCWESDHIVPWPLWTRDLNQLVLKGSTHTPAPTSYARSLTGATAHTPAADFSTFALNAPAVSTQPVAATQLHLSRRMLRPNEQ